MQCGQIIETCLETASISCLIDYLQSQSTAHAGTAPAKVKRDVVQALRRVPAEARYPLVVALCQSTDPGAQEIGALCSTDFYAQYPKDVNEWLYKLADSAHWEVREWVASACGQLLTAHFDDYSLVMSDWSSDKSENVRRAVVLAVMYAGRARQADRAEPLLDLLVPLLSDRAKYVMDNLGPFALGSALFHYYPTAVLQRMRAWVQSEDEQVRWNVAMAFTAAAAVTQTHEALPIWQVLARDPHPYVQKAWKKAMRNIEKRTHVQVLGEESKGDHDGRGVETRPLCCD